MPCAFSVTDDLFGCHLWWKNKINQENVNPVVTVWKLIDWQQLLLQDPGWMSSSVSLSIDVWVMPVVCPCFLPAGMSESEQFLKGTSQIKTLSPEDIEGMRVVCKVTISIDCLLSRRAFLANLYCSAVLTRVPFAAGKRSSGHCSRDGETRRYNRRNWPRCASGALFWNMTQCLIFGSTKQKLALWLIIVHPHVSASHVSSLSTLVWTVKYIKWTHLKWIVDL